MTNKTKAPARTAGASDDSATQSVACSKVEWALAYAAAGYHVLPLNPDHPEHECTDPATCSIPKEPFGLLVPNGQKDATRDTDTITSWWQQCPDANIGIVCRLSGIVVIDLDKHKDDADGLKNFKALCEANGYSLSGLPAQGTANGGVHLFFKHPANRALKNNFGPGMDVRSNNYIVAAPSTYHGRHYKWVPARELLKVQPPEMPAWLADLVTKLSVTATKTTALVDDSQRKQQQGAAILKSFGLIGEGARNNTAYKAACRLKEEGLSEETTFDLMSQHLQCSPPLREAELHKAVRSAYETSQNSQGSKHPDNDPLLNAVSTPAPRDANGDSAVVADPEESKIILPNWPHLSDKALPGLAGDIVTAVVEHSEADPAAVLITFLNYFAACAGDSAHVPIGDTRHPARLFALIVGASSRARKGTSADPIRRLFKEVKEIDFRSLFQPGPPICAPVSDGPLSSGEGLIHAVRDASPYVDEKGKLKDAGAADKRLFAIEGEFGAALSAAQRDGNTLSAILRMAWDRGDIQPLIKNNPTKATGAHICITGHITRRELLKLLKGTDVFNGFANRFLWVCARRSKLVPFPEGLTKEFLSKAALQISELLIKAQAREAIKLSEAAREKWKDLYPVLTRDRTGMLGAVTARAEAQVTRLSLIYALLDDSDAIEPHHIDAAIALWQYCESSAAYIFGNSTTDPNANRIIAALTAGPKTLTELNDIFSGHLPAENLSAILLELQAAGCITQTTRGGGRRKGKGTTIVSLTPGFNLPCAEFADFEE